MTKRGVVFLLGLVVFLVLSVLAAAFFMRTIAENNAVRRQVASTQAFWYAEQGLAEAMDNLPSTSPLASPLGCAPDYCNYNTITNTVTGSPDLYNITSTGRVSVQGSPITRTVESYVSLDVASPGNFLNAIEVGGNLSMSNNVDIEPEPAGNYTRTNSNFTFSGKFGFSYDEVKYAAMSGEPGFVFYDQDTYPKPFNLINNEVVVIEFNSTQTHKVQLPSPGQGSGIIIINVINGDVDIEGGDFDGIIWAIGELKITGNPTLAGSVLSEVDFDITTKLGGTAYLEWNETAISNALNLTKTIADRSYKSWREVP